MSVFGGHDEFRLLPIEDKFLKTLSISRPLGRLKPVIGEKRINDEFVIRLGIAAILQNALATLLAKSLSSLMTLVINTICMDVFAICLW